MKNVVGLNLKTFKINTNKYQIFLKAKTDTRRWRNIPAVIDYAYSVSA